MADRTKVRAGQRISQAEREEFLGYIRDGYSRPVAARKINPEYTGMMFQKLLAQEGLSYDHQFAIAYAEARAYAAKHSKPKIGRRSGYSSRPFSAHGALRAMHITVEQQETFIQQVREGMPLRQAAEYIGTTLWQLDQLCRISEEFAREFAKAREEGYPVMQESLRAEVQRQAFAGEYRALRDLSMIHLPEFAVLNRQLKGEHDIDLRAALEAKFSSLSKDQLDKIIEIVEDGGTVPQIEASVVEEAA